MSARSSFWAPEKNRSREACSVYYSRLLETRTDRNNQTPPLCSITSPQALRSWMTHVNLHRNTHLLFLLNTVKSVSSLYKPFHPVAESLLKKKVSYVCLSSVLTDPKLHLNFNPAGSEGQMSNYWLGKEWEINLSALPFTKEWWEPSVHFGLVKK